MATKKKVNRNPKVQDDTIVDPPPAGPIDVMSGDSLLPEPEDRGAKKPGWNPKGEELKIWTQFRRRKQALIMGRNNVYGLNIDAEMRRFDTEYLRRQANIPASELDSNQRPLAINNAFGKIQTALGILIDADPKYIMEEDNPKYSANREFLRALAEKSFRNTNSLGQFKLSVLNAAKRGWFIGRTYNRRLYHDARFLKGIDKDGKREYETKRVTKMDDVAYMNLNNYNAWLDEQTKPEDFYSARDWMWREVWFIDDLRRVFPEAEFPNMKHVQSGGDTRESIQGVFTRNTQGPWTGVSPQASKEGMTEVYFYENQYSDRFIIEANNVMICNEPLPQNNKRLSCVYGSWHFRADDTPYGIGIIEEMENDEELIDRILNMSMRQLLLTISPMGFYTGAEDFEDENIRISPGIMRRAMDPKSITWTSIPEGNQTALEKIEWLQGRQDAKTGITPTIEGMSLDASKQTAFQVGVDREAGLKRLRLPLKSLQYALQQEFYNRISLIQQVYSDFEVEHLSSQDEINAYLDEVNADPEFYFIENEGKAGEEKFFAKRYRMAALSVEKTDDGSFIEAEETKFFAIKPEYLAFQGFVTVDESSLLTQSEALEQANTLRMVNMFIPLLQGPIENNAKLAKQLLVAFNKDPKGWLPEKWLQFLSGEKPKDPMDTIPGGGIAPNGPTGQPPNAPTALPPSEMDSAPEESAINGAAFTA